MAWISSTTAVYAHSSVLFTIAFYLWKTPYTLTEQPFVHAIGQAMLMPHETLHNQDTNWALTVLLALLGVTDITQLFVKNREYFEGVLPVRLTVAFVCAAWSYMREHSILHNDVTFVFIFSEMWFHFVLYDIVKQEKNAREKKLQELIHQKILDGETFD